MSDEALNEGVSLLADDIDSTVSPYKDTITLQAVAFNNLLNKIKHYPMAGKNTGIKLIPSPDRARLQIQNMRNVKIVKSNNITWLVITDETADVKETKYQISGNISFVPQASNHTTEASLVPGMFNVLENEGFKQTVRVTGFDSNGNLSIPNNTINSGNITCTGNIQNNGNLTSTGIITGQKVRGAVFNDYAEYRESMVMQPGVCVVETGYGDLERSTERLQLGAAITTDTFGFSIGQTDKAQTPVAVCGRVLAYPYEDRYEFTAGAAVCSAPDGKVSLMTREEIKEWPDAIVGYVSEIPEYDYWGTEKIYVNGRIWIKVK